MAEEAPKSNQPPTSTAGEMKAGATTIVEAAKSACTQQTDKVSKANMSKAAEDALEATKNGVGQSVEKARDYLQKFQSTPEAAAPDVAEKKETAPAPEVAEKEETAPAPDVAEKEETAPAPDADEKESTGGIGGLINKAKGLF